MLAWGIWGLGAIFLLAEGVYDDVGTSARMVMFNLVSLGTGSGYSVLDMLRAFELAAGKPIAHELVARRPGDVAQCYADPALAERELGWRAERDQADMCRDHWHWQKQNPAGYA